MSKIPVVSKKVLIPFCLVTVLFALWGFANNFTDTMVKVFKTVMELSNKEASMVQMVFYMGYFTMAIPAAIFMTKFSYKKGIQLGLVLYMIGALLFYPASITEQFWVFLLAYYILTFGLAFLETTANPYILSMGDPKTATQRLNLAQAFNPVGSILGVLAAREFVLSVIEADKVKPAYNIMTDLVEKARIKTHDLATVSTPHVILGIFLLGILVLISLSKMPQYKSAGDEEETGSFFDAAKELFSQNKYKFGVLAQLFYVGAQINCWTYISHYADPIGVSGDSAANYYLAALILFISGRWICTLLLKYIDSSVLLYILAIFAGVLTLGVIFIEGMMGLYCLVLVSFCMSLMYPTIYGIALEDAGKNTKYGASFLVMAIVGGALLPFVQASIIDFGGDGYSDMTIMGVREVNFSFIIPFICFVFVAAYGLYVNQTRTTAE